MDALYNIKKGMCEQKNLRRKIIKPKLELLELSCECGS